MHDLAGNYVTTLDGAGNWVHSNVFSGGRLVAAYTSDGTRFQLSDWLGTRRVQAAANGKAGLSCFSYPFGDGLACAGSDADATEQHFTGKERDGTPTTETGLDYFGARYYASELGRYLTPDWSASSDPDPVPYADMLNPQSLNLYGYVKNNAINAGDPNGHCEVDGEHHNAVWCWFHDHGHLLGFGYTHKEQADLARKNLADVKNILINGTSVQSFLKTATDDQVLKAQRAIGDFLMSKIDLICGDQSADGIPIMCGVAFPIDFATRDTANWSASFRTEGEARAFARTKLGDGAVEVEPGKWRSADGKWQYRAKPGDIVDNHIHLEELNPRTGEVIQNVHLRWPGGGSR